MSKMNKNKMSLAVLALSTAACLSDHDCDDLSVAGMHSASQTLVGSARISVADGRTGVTVSVVGDFGCASLVAGAFVGEGDDELRIAQCDGRDPVSDCVVDAVDCSLSVVAPAGLVTLRVGVFVGPDTPASYNVRGSFVSTDR